MTINLATFDPTDANAGMRAAEMNNRTHVILVELLAAYEKDAQYANQSLVQRAHRVIKTGTMVPLARTR